MRRRWSYFPPVTRTILALEPPRKWMHSGLEVILEVVSVVSLKEIRKNVSVVAVVVRYLNKL